MTTIEQPTALAVRDENALDLTPRFVTSIADLREQLHQLEQFKRDIMIEGVDFGTIPGTPKPTLLKPGAEKLSLAFGLAPTFESAQAIEDWDRGFFHYEERCVLTSRRSGSVVASASGSANSKEPRYRWRDAKPACPNCGKDLRRSRNRDGEQGEPGWYCWNKPERNAFGCGANYPAAQITGTVGRIENPEPYELVNTIKKMAQKRALVAAILIGTGGSGIWTQDIEDMPSVSGDDPNVIDVTPPQQRGADNGDLVRSADDRVWKRWLDLAGEAQGLGLRVTAASLPIGRTQLISRGTMLATSIEQRKRQLAEEDAARAEGVLDRQKAARHAEILDGEYDAQDRGWTPQQGVESVRQDPEQTAPARQEQAADPVDQQRIVSKKDPVWQAWEAACSKAIAASLEVDVNAVQLGMTVGQIDSATKSLLAEVAEAAGVAQPAFS